MLSARLAVCRCYLPPALLLPPRSPPLDLACRHHLPPSSSAAVLVRRRRCHPPPSLLSNAATFRPRSHHCHSAVSTFSCHPLFSFPVVVRRLILHAVVFCRYCFPPLLSLSAAAVFHRHSHHHHSAVSAVSHRPLLSFPIAVFCPILRVLVVRHRRHPPLLLSAVAVPRLVLPPTLTC